MEERPEKRDRGPQTTDHGPQTTDHGPPKTEYGQQIIHKKKCLVNEASLILN